MSFNGGVIFVDCLFAGPIPYYIVKNSWGTDFGHGGYVYVKYSNNTCCKIYHFSFV